MLTYIGGDIRGPIKHPHTSPGESCQGTDDTHHRRGSSIQIDVEELRTGVHNALEEKNFREFSTQLEIPHDILHMDMECDMYDTLTSSYDPVFYLHHAYIA